MTQINKDLALEEKIQFIKESIEQRIQSFEVRRKNNKFKAIVFHVCILLLSAVSTIILGLELDDTFFIKKYIKNIALVISSLIVVVSGYNTFFEHKDLWINYTKTKTQLYNLKFEIEYYLKGNMNIEIHKLEEFKKEYQNILNETNKQWNNLRNV